MPGRMPIPEAASAAQIVFLPPMSGLAATETRLDQGAVNVRVGKGRTAEVLRNLCLRINDETPELWQRLAAQIRELFGVELDEPRYISERGEIVMAYREDGVKLDLSSSGRGLQQTLLILAYMCANPGAIILLDEPDAHLEILRQRQIYKLINDVALENGNQIIAASHSEVLLNEAASRDMVIAFVGQPHRLQGRPSQVHKALSEIGFDQYYQGAQAGWVLYLEGASDLAILQSFAERLGSEAAMQALQRPFVRYVGNQPRAAAQHFYGLREVLPELSGVALFDRLDSEPEPDGAVQCMMWKRREIENYLCSRATLEAYAIASARVDEPAPLFSDMEKDRRLSAMREAVAEVEEAMNTLGKGSPWDSQMKASDDFLIPLFKAYFAKLELPNLMDKKQFYELAMHVPEEELAPEITEKLEQIADVYASARPMSSTSRHRH